MGNKIAHRAGRKLKTHAKRIASAAKTAQSAAKATYRNVMPHKKRHRVMIWVAFLVYVMSASIQLLYPPDKTLPLAKLNGEWVGFVPETEISGRVETIFQGTKLRIKTASKTGQDIMLGTSGAVVLADVSAKQLTDYPFWQRFIPLSIFWHQPHVDELTVQFSSVQLQAFSEEHSKLLSTDPVNAGLEIKDGKLLATNEKIGHIVTPDNIKQALWRARYPMHRTVEVAVEGQARYPTKTRADFAAVRRQAELALARPVTVRAAGKELTVSQGEKASWMKIDGADAKNTTLSIDKAALHQSINTWSQQVGWPAGQTRITLQNGREIARIEGEKGSKINNDELSTTLTKYLLTGQGSLDGIFTTELIPVDPSIIYNSSYTATEEGLRAYVADKARHGAWFSIRQLGAGGWSADADANDSVVSASTYKLFVAKRLFDEMNKGNIHWHDAMLDTTVSGCFDRMTIASTNPCAEAWLSRFGRQNMNTYLYNLGFSRAVTFTHPYAAHTSAADLTRFMIGVEQGTLLSGAQRDRLLYSLSHHPYRAGIPAGSQAQQVYNKVGFLWDYVHDTAIVRHPRGTYVMTIMTKGKSYTAIAVMTREIEKIMYP